MISTTNRQVVASGTHQHVAVSNSPFTVEAITLDGTKIDGYKLHSQTGLVEIVHEKPERPSPNERMMHGTVTVTGRELFVNIQQEFNPVSLQVQQAYD